MNEDFYANIANYEIEQYNEEYKASQRRQYSAALAKIRRNNPEMTSEEYERQIVITRRQYKF